VSKRRILVTGATGGLGIALVREALRRGHQVRATGRSLVAGNIVAATGAQFVACDLAGEKTDLPELMKGCDSIIHAAALSASWGPQRAFEIANIDVTNHLLDVAAKVGLARFVFVSSPSIFAAFHDRIAIDEGEMPATRPLNHYARTKLEAERNVLAKRQDVMACCAIRPRALVGEGDRVILPKLAELAARKRMPLPRGGKALIELTDLRDAAWAICEAEERAPQLGGMAINISGGRPVAVREVACKLAHALGKKPKLISLPVGFARCLAALLESVALLTRTAREPVLTRYTLATLAYSQTFDPRPAERLLGYRPRHDALETILDQAGRLALRERDT
jgi:2-alkyl-3-oxoalkanoate reductase